MIKKWLGRGGVILGGNWFGFAFVCVCVCVCGGGFRRLLFLFVCVVVVVVVVVAAVVFNQSYQFVWGGESTFKGAYG